MIEYCVASADDSTGLEVAVNKLVAEGWQPLGGVAVSSFFSSWGNERKGYTESESCYTFAQAMTRPSTAKR